MGVLKQFRYKLNNKWLYPRVKMYSLYKRDLWGVLTLRRRYKYRKVVYRILRRRRRVGRRITEEIYKGFQAKRRKRGFRYLVHITKMRLTEYYHNIKEYQYGLLGRKAYKQQGLWSSNFWALLEFRLDTLLVKCNFFNNQVAARQYIRFNNIYVNTKRIRYANYVCSVGDVITVGQVPILNPFLDAFTFDRYYKGHYIVDLFPNFLRTLRELVGGLWIILDAFNIFKKIIKKSRFFADRERKYSFGDETVDKNNKRILYQTEKHNYLSLILKSVLKKKKTKMLKKKGKRVRVLNPQFLLNMLLLHFKLQAYRSYEVYSFHALWFWKMRYWRIKRQKRRVSSISRLLKRGQKYLKFKKRGYRNPFSKKSLLFYKRAGYIVKTGASFFLRRRRPFAVLGGHSKKVARFRAGRRFVFFKKFYEKSSRKESMLVLFRYVWFKFYLKFLFILETNMLDRWVSGFFADFFKDFAFFVNYNTNVVLNYSKNIVLNYPSLLTGINTKYVIKDDFLFSFFVKSKQMSFFLSENQHVAYVYEQDVLLNLNVYSYIFKELFNFLLNVSTITIDNIYLFIQKFKFYVHFIKKNYFLVTSIFKKETSLLFNKTMLFGFSSFVYFYELKKALSLNKYFTFFKNKILMGKPKYNLSFIKRWDFYFFKEQLHHQASLALLSGRSSVYKVNAFTRYGKSISSTSVVEPLYSLRLQRFSKFYNYFSVPFVKALSLKIIGYVRSKPTRKFLKRFDGYNRRYTRKLKRRWFKYLNKFVKKRKRKHFSLKKKKKTGLVARVLKLKKKKGIRKLVYVRPLQSLKTRFMSEKSFYQYMAYKYTKYMKKFLIFFNTVDKEHVIDYQKALELYSHKLYSGVYNWFYRRLHRVVPVYKKVSLKKLFYKSMKGVKIAYKTKKNLEKLYTLLQRRVNKKYRNKKRVKHKIKKKLEKRFNDLAAVSFRHSIKNLMSKKNYINRARRKRFLRQNGSYYRKIFMIRIKRRRKKRNKRIASFFKKSTKRLRKRGFSFIYKHLFSNKFFFFKQNLLKGYQTRDVLSNKTELPGLFYFFFYLKNRINAFTVGKIANVGIFKLKILLSNYFSAGMKNIYYSLGSFFLRGRLNNNKRLKFGFRNDLRKQLSFYKDNIKEQNVFLFTTSMLTLVEESLGWNMKALFKKTILSTNKYKKRYLFTKEKSFFKRKKKYYFSYNKMRYMARARFYDRRHHKYIYMKGYPAYFMISFKLMSIVVLRKPKLNMLTYPFFVRPEYLVHNFKRRLFF